MNKARAVLWAMAGGLSILLVAGGVQAEPRKGATVTANMSGFKSDKGQVIIGLYKNPDNFPQKIERAPQRGTAKIKGGKSTFAFKNVPPGVWAIAVFHDENGNGKFDTNFLGIPKEGWGTSRNARPAVGAPDFEDAKFTVKQGDRAFKILMKY